MESHQHECCILEATKVTAYMYCKLVIDSPVSYSAQPGPEIQPLAFDSDGEKSSPNKTKQKNYPD